MTAATTAAYRTRGEEIAALLAQLAPLHGLTIGPYHLVTCAIESDVTLIRRNRQIVGVRDDAGRASMQQHEYEPFLAALIAHLAVPV